MMVVDSRSSSSPCPGFRDGDMARDTLQIVDLPGLVQIVVVVHKMGVRVEMFSHLVHLSGTSISSKRGSRSRRQGVTLGHTHA